MQTMSSLAALLLLPLTVGASGPSPSIVPPSFLGSRGVETVSPTAPLCPPTAPTVPFSGLHLQAIVQLRDLQLPRPQVQGQATLPLQFLADSRSFTLLLSTGGQTGKFVLDTGASTTIIGSELVQRLGLVGEPIPRQKFDLAMAGDDCPALNATLHRLPLLAIAGVQVKNLPALEFSRAFLPGGISGVLGMNFLRNFDLQVNPQIRQLQLLPSTATQPIPATAVPLSSKLGVMLAQVKINGQGPFTFLLDTGADSVFLSQEVAQQLKLDQGPRQPLNVLGFCGLEKAAQVKLSQVELQQHRQTNLEGIILSSPLLSLLKVDGILGQEFFNRYQQHWRFSVIDATPQVNGGSLLLTPLPGQEANGLGSKQSSAVPRHEPHLVAVQ